MVPALIPVLSDLADGLLQPRRLLQAFPRALLPPPIYLLTPITLMKINYLGPRPLLVRAGGLLLGPPADPVYRCNRPHGVELPQLVLFLVPLCLVPLFVMEQMLP